MRKILIAAAALTALTGCSLKGAHAPQAAIPFADAGFTVMGQTTEEACGTYIFIDWGHLFANQSATLSAPTGGFSLSALPIVGPGPEEKRALYHALDKIPDATHVLDVRAESKTTGFAPFGWPVFGSRCATVHARGVKIDERPNPQQG
ncbi:MAG: lipoprotein [Oligoflexia bacterium]|nr:lipoprotein [Oligoflexia bacterium]